MNEKTPPPPPPTPDYAAAIASINPKCYDFKPTDDQRLCIKVLADFAHGEHHMYDVKACGTGVSMSYHGNLATFDYNGLTKLVLLGHYWGVRLAIFRCNGGKNTIHAHRRASSDDKAKESWFRHPTLLDLRADIDELIQSLTPGA